jgi:cyclin B
LKVRAQRVKEASLSVDFLPTPNYTNCSVLRRKIKKSEIKLSLENHSISQKQRAKMVDWIIEVLEIFDQSLSTMFRALFILELYLKTCKTPLKISDLHLIGVVSMLIASKIEEVKVIKMESIIVDICKYKFEKQQIIDKEQEIVTKLMGQLNLPTVHDYLSAVTNIIQLSPKDKRLVKNYSNILLKMFLFSYDIMNVYSFSELACYSLIISLKLFEHSRKVPSVQKLILKIIKMGCLDKGQILDNLNYLRDYASEFQGKFPFNNLQINSEITN